MKVHNVSKYPWRYWFSHLFQKGFTDIFLIPQKTCCWFISILLPLHPSCCLLWCQHRAQTNKTSRFISPDFVIYPASCAGGYHQDSMQSLLETGEQHRSLSPLIKLILCMTSAIIEPLYFLTLILKDYHHGYTTVNTTSALSQFTWQYNLLWLGEKHTIAFLLT